MGLIDDVLSSLTVEDVLPYLKNEYSLNGDNYVGLCPTGHDSKSGKSFSISVNSPTFNCFNCGVKGNYIHLVELAKTGQCSTKKGITDSFKVALLELANLVGIDTNKVETSEHVEDSIFSIVNSVISYYTRFMNPEIMEALKRKYGLTNDFIKNEKIGYGFQCPSKELLDVYSKEELLKTGLFNQTKSGGIFHIYQDRIVFPYLRNGNPVYSSGRKTSKTIFNGSKENIPKYFKQYIHSEKRPYVSPSIKNICITYKGQTDYLILTEGIVDFFQLKQHGISSVCIGTTQISKDLIDELSMFCSKYKMVYICNDNDSNNAGLEGAIKTSKEIINNGVFPKIIVLPKLGKDKMDIADFIKENGINDFKELRDSHSFTVPEIMLQNIPKNLDPQILQEKIATLYPILSKYPKEECNIFSMYTIPKYFKLPKSSPFVQSIKSKINDLQVVTSKKSISKTDAFEDITNHTMISSGQDYVGNNLYYTVTKPVVIQDKKGSRVENKAYLIRSDKKMIPLIDYQLTDCDIVLSKKLNPQYKADNWSMVNGDYSIQKYLNNEARVNVGDLFNEIVGIFKKYIYFTQKGTAEHLSIVIMTSYIYMCFHTTGYLHLWAEKRSGKTTALEIMNELGFNSKLSSSISDAAIFRLIELYRPLLLIDEAENLNPSQKQKESSPSEKLELFKSGYKKTGSATRCEGVNNTVSEFSNYCPKVFSSIKNLDATLEDRTIVHAFKRATKEVVIPQLVPDKLQDMFSNLRDKLHIFGLDNAKSISMYYENLSIYEEELIAHKITHRNREIWGSYLAVALFIDTALDTPYVFDTLLDLAQFTSENKALFEHSDSKPLVLLEKFYLWTRQKRQSLILDSIQKDIYYRRDIIKDFIQDFLRKDDDEGAFIYTHYTSVKQTLMRFHVVDRNSEVNKGGMEKSTYLYIPPEKLLEALKTYKPDCCDEVLVDIAEILDKKPTLTDEGID